MEPAGRQNHLMLTLLVLTLRVTVPLTISGGWDVRGSDVVLITAHQLN